MRYFYFAISEYAAFRIYLKGYVSHQHDMKFIMDASYIILEFKSVYEGTTGIAAINLERQFIGIEQGQQLFNIAKASIEMTNYHCHKPQYKK